MSVGLEKNGEHWDLTSAEKGKGTHLFFSITLPTKRGWDGLLSQRKTNGCRPDCGRIATSGP